MKFEGILLVAVCIVGLSSAQKLFFKSNKLIQNEVEEVNKVKDDSVLGFGFGERRKYFTSRKQKLPDQPKVDKEFTVTCPDKRTTCPDGNTCCQVSLTAYGCCPLQRATCCMDKKHCCPFGTKCDLSRQACISGEMIVPWFEKTPGVQKVDNALEPVSVESVICPDGEHQCADGQTCCKSAEGYSCCPLPKAVCCADQIHCCPADTKCDTAHGRCVQSNGDYVSLVKKHAASKKIKEIEAVLSVPCDDKHACPTANTCCLLDNGEWGCCPEPSAVCCPDHLHCCPHGKTCDNSSSSCVDGLQATPWLTKTAATFIQSVKCDSTHECPSGNTCCKLASGQWGCCPLPQAVCCSDGTHCCPDGTTCDTTQGKCNRGNIQVDWFMKQPAIEVSNVKCDSTHECPSGNTCCKLASGQWGCCPLPQAVCCSDGTHCCPDGTTCDTTQGKCNRGNIQVDWFMKQPAIEVSNVKCDSTHECPSGNTCCKLASGQWGCCPLPQAVCCSDGTHCCPDGTTCDTTQGKCNRGNIQVDWFMKQPAIEVSNVKCDSTHECPSGNTCCKLASGQWGCCPLPQAVCCSDGTHCCPDGTTCDTTQGKCNRGNIQVDWFMKQPAIEVSNVKCDSTHECPSGNTCCKLASGQWGCCPLPQAVCCSDGTHCCPDGTTCDTTQGKCNRGNIQVDWFMKQSAIEVSNVKCDSTHECPSGNTCCKLASGQWGCCPLPQAVCCSDGTHCCPDGTTCDTTQGKCNRGNIQVDWFMKQPAIEVSNVKCDSTHECPSGNTCCKLASGQWGCCPLPQAVCCSDGTHCCPDGTTCDTTQGKCNRGNIQVDWFMKQPAIEVSNVKCDSTHECPSGNTCCKLASGQWGCCPLPQAVCCSDGTHCCPDGTTCDTTQGKCNRGNIQVDWFMKQPAIEVSNVKCDSTHECPSGNTCCKLASGQWGCCPLPQAVCCSDGTHCCPDGTTCDTTQGKCNRGNIQVDWFMKQPAIEVSNVKCDSTHECPSGNTCCKLASGQWGCCPLPQAVCCSDGTHCCPDGTTCDTTQGKCNRGNIQVDWFMKQPAIEVSNVKCDSTHECPSGNTCCKLASGQWGCCPLPQAVCCSDGTHCCPDGTTCDTTQGKCNRGNIQVDWFMKQPAIEVSNVKCDSTHECPSGNTCCKLASGQWGCCPLPQAVCCSDGTHCCPDGTTCDTTQGKCNRGNIQVDWFMKQPAIEVSNVKCDSTHECPSGNTCCKLASGQWGCCPLPQAVCCSDGTHCCPDGTTCDTTQGKCNRGNIQVDWFMKQPAIEVSNVKCDSTHECPSGNTCCKLASGQWGCCPLPQAVCCSDGTHCCPDGTTCDTTQGKCNRGNIQVDWFMKQPAIEVSNVKCDSTHECPSGNTCCKLASGQWGCCPLPQAVCCSDGTHCCPDGTTCDTTQGKCNRGNIQVDWFMKQPAIEVSNVKCDSTHECPSGNTCCKLASGQWGCCPLPQAVCCSDGTHCCPDGTTCDTTQGKCNRGNIQVDWFMKQPAIEVSNVKCDSTHECPSGNTCCKLASGQWGCCPLPQAVCCSDGTHCCPDGTTCDTTQGKCNRGNIQVDWFMKQPAIEVSNVKCDSTHECPSGNSCCKLASGQWGCCPLPQAVCCSDGTHCCPDGTTCDTTQGKCNRGNIQVDWFMKQPAIEVSNVKCDSTHECPSGNTCCKLASGQWGCCPLPQAVCCSDGTHCCPDGTTCDTTQGKCNRGNIQVDWFMKQPAIEVSNVKCDSTHECPSGNTCCKLASGQWGCCPLPQAVCCSDGTHCCPDGTTCDTTQGKCNRGNIQVDWFMKQPAIEVSNVKCDSTHECPSGNTCCKLASGQWGCCPLPQAVCCSDGTHCCPDGTTCDTTQGKCNRGNIQVDWFMKQPAIEVSNVKCDSTHECPSGNTCCKLASGQWGCCPLPQAVCCNDHVHCCPNGTTCDVTSGKCNAEVMLDWFPMKLSGNDVTDVICPDGSECQDGETCCKMNSANSYGCCPLPNAVCCDDGQHCCPHSYRCNLASGMCERGMMKLPWLLTNVNKKQNLTLDIIKISAVETDLKDVKCSDETTCPDQYSCCPNGKGGYNCCPLPNGVCCSDNQHCCPHGYICDEEPGICRIPELNKAVSNFMKKLGSKKAIPHSQNVYSRERSMYEKE